MMLSAAFVLAEGKRSESSFLKPVLLIVPLLVNLK